MFMHIGDFGTFGNNSLITLHHKKNISIPDVRPLLHVFGVGESESGVRFTLSDFT